MKVENNIGKSLIETLAISEAGEVVKDYLEIGIDSLFAEGVLKELPVVRTLFAFYKAQISVRDFILLKKIILFLNEVNKVDEKQKKKFIEKISTDKNCQHKVGEQLVLYMDRMDDIEKSIILAKIFVGFINEKIDYVTFRRLANAVDRTFIDDLKKMKQYYSSLKNIEKDNLYHLVQSGLASIESIMFLDTDGMIFKPSKLGEIFIDLVFDH